jgi:hypothetical protein
MYKLPSLRPVVATTTTTDPASARPGYYRDGGV